MCVHVFVCADVCILMYVCVRALVYVCVCLCLSVQKRVCASVRVRVCGRMRVRVAIRESECAVISLCLRASVVKGGGSASEA